MARAIRPTGPSRRCATPTPCHDVVDALRDRYAYTYGARTDEQLSDNLAAAGLRLSDDERARLDEVSAPPLIYPHRHQAKTARDRLGAPELTLLGPHLG